MGGLATLARYGPDHMRTIGKRDATVFWSRYSLKNLRGTSQFAIVKRDTSEVIAFTSGRLGT
jgi:hypothetical protein